MNSQRDKRAAATRTLWWSEIDSSALALSLPHCATELEMGSEICNGKNDLEYKESARHRAQVQTRLSELMKGKSTENKQGDELGSAMKKELNFSGTVSDNGTRPKDDAVPFVDWTLARSMEKNPRALERMGSGLSVVTGSDGESVACDDLRRYSMSMEEVMKLPSSQYKGVVYQPNVGRWGAQIYEKHQRVWLGTFNGEEDAAMAYHRAALKVRGRDAMTNFSPVGGGDPAAQFIGKHSKEEIVEMLRKHTYDEDMTMTVDRPATINNAEASGQVGTGLGTVCEQNKEHLFDKTVTPSDVGKLNRLVIPKQHAEKYFPLDVDSIEKGLLLNFEDNTRKLWTFRYSYWNSSQSYVLTKGWTRFVKDKKLEAGDIVSFQRGSTDQRHQLYISWRRGPSGLSRFRFGPQPHQSKAGLVYPVKGSSSLNPLNSGTQATVLYNSQWMPIFWPSSSNPNAFTQLSAHTVSPLVNKVVQWDAMWSQSRVTPLHGTLPFSVSEPPHKQTIQSRLYDINSCGLQPTDQHLSLHNSFNSSEGGTNIEALHPFVNPAPRSAAQELENPEHKPASSVDLTTKKGVRLFGVTLAEPRR